MENKFLRKVEKATEKEAERLVQNVVEKNAERIQVDVAGFRNILRIAHPKLWEEIKKIGSKHLSMFLLNIQEYGTLISNK